MILVTGGTGLVGSHLLFSLLKENDRIRAIHRKSSDLISVKNVFAYFSDDAEGFFSRIEWVEANLNDITALTKAMQGIKQVYHAAAYVSFEPKNYYKLKKSNIEGTANLVNMCLAHNVEKLCHVSSIAALGRRLDSGLINEETAWNSEEENSVYAITKYGAELEVWRGSQEGLSTVIIQPGVILGEGYWKSSSGALIKAVAKGIHFYTPGGVGVIDVQDVVEIMIQLMKSEIQNEAYVLVSENLSYRKLLEQIAYHFKVKPPRISVPKWMMTIFGRIDALGSLLLGRKRSLTRPIVNSMYETTFYDSNKIKRDLGYTFRPFEKTLGRIAKNYSMES